MSGPKKGKQQIHGDIKLAPNCIICDECTIIGDVTIGGGTIVHPRAKIIAEAGPIIIGENNLIEDRAEIVNKVNTNDGPSGPTRVMIIGNLNVFEVSAHTEALKIGDNNVFESKSFVGKEVVVSNNCTIGAACVLIAPGVLKENTAIYGTDCHRRLTQGHQSQLPQIEHLAKLLPNFHHILKHPKKSKDLVK